MHRIGTWTVIASQLFFSQLGRAAVQLVLRVAHGPERADRSCPRRADKLPACVPLREWRDCDTRAPALGHEELPVVDSSEERAWQLRSAPFAAIDCVVSKWDPAAVCLPRILGPRSSHSNS